MTPLYRVGAWAWLVYWLLLDNSLLLSKVIFFNFQVVIKEELEEKVGAMSMEVMDMLALFLFKCFLQ